MLISKGNGSELKKTKAGLYSDKLSIDGYRSSLHALTKPICSSIALINVALPAMYGGSFQIK